MTEIVHSSEPKPPAAPAAKPPSDPSAEVNFALVLSRTIDSVRQNPVELRAAVYELARIKLKEQFGREDAKEVERLTAALEEAIQGVESFSSEEDSRRVRLAADAAPPMLPPAAESLAPDNNSPRSAWQPKRPPAAKAGFGTFGSLARFAAIVLVAAGVIAAIVMWPRLRSLTEAGRAQRLAQSQPAKPVMVSARPNIAPALARVEAPPLPFPVPTRFGIYAVSNNQLQELKALPGKVPDIRVSVSAAINTPSATTLSDNRPKFIVFRRDGGVSAPDRIEARLVARVTRAMGFDSGKAKLTPEQDAWVIRNIAIPYGVGPVDDQHPDMYLIQPEAADPLPAGRYALVLKGVGFDFTIDGPVTDPRQCMERVDAVNGAFYSPCPQPDKPR